LHSQRVIEILQTGVAGSTTPGASRRATVTAAVPSVLGQQIMRAKQQRNAQG
jgi:hypothetical protein